MITDLVQLLWALLLPIVFLLLLREKRRGGELLLKAVIVYGLAGGAYEIIRLSALTRTRDNWLVLGVKVFLVFLLLELAWGQIHPPEQEESPPTFVQVLYAIGSLIGFVGVVLSFLGLA